MPKISRSRYPPSFLLIFSADELLPTSHCSADGIGMRSVFIHGYPILETGLIGPLDLSRTYQPPIKDHSMIKKNFKKGQIDSSDLHQKTPGINQEQ